LKIFGVSLNQKSIEELKTMIQEECNKLDQNVIQRSIEKE